MYVYDSWPDMLTTAMCKHLRKEIPNILLTEQLNERIKLSMYVAVFIKSSLLTKMQQTYRSTYVEGSGMD